MPFLNNCKTYKDLHALNGKLVRYLCVVSDIQDPEMYMTCLNRGEGKDLQLGMYRDLQEDEEAA